MSIICGNNSFVLKFEKSFVKECSIYSQIRLEAKKEELHRQRKAKMFISKKLISNKMNKAPLPVIRMRLPIRK